MTKPLVIAGMVLILLTENRVAADSQNNNLDMEQLIIEMQNASRLGDGESFKKVFRSITAHTAPSKELRRRQILSLCARLRAGIKEALGIYNDRKNRPITRGNMSPADKYPSGISPSAVSEPEIRKKYEEAIAENQRRSELNVKLASLDRLIVEIDHYVVSLISVAYADTPEDRAERDVDLAGFENSAQLIKSLKESE
jgi:hypothetical protein